MTVRQNIVYVFSERRFEEQYTVCVYIIWKITFNKYDDDNEEHKFRILC